MVGRFVVVPAIFGNAGYLGGEGHSLRSPGQGELDRAVAVGVAAEVVVVAAVVVLERRRL